ncbi:hypothetical protein GH714_018583 [Hevea brasiliensis]|uniref:Leucine-rich repeat-containing N-terminal plant-type domain-containing protein n=1 Tax=Hevea brasiliensis TaxID=3981 RepID=A0A6A6N253_HEVBR|nr:hypothetical protein GH714_018583 [Hevea brasiliensis]
MQGQLRESLLDLPYLSYLDLSLNDFLQIQIPEFIGSLSRLKYLNLSNANFRGTIPDQLGNLSHLVSLDLSGNGYSLRVNNLNWLYHLSPLKFLDLSGVDLSNSVNWLDAINMLSSLIELNLFACKLHNLPQSLPRVNFTSLKILDLSFNSLNGTIPDWLFEIDQSLVFLYLRRNEFHGSIPEAFGNMTSLIVLDLSENNLEADEDCCKWSGVGCNNRAGHVITLDLRRHNSSEVVQVSQFIYCQFQSDCPDHLGNFSLQSLDLSGNIFFLKANNLDWLSGLSSLEVLDLGGVDLSGAVNWLVPATLGLTPELQHIKHSPLRELHLSYNKLNDSLERILPQLSELVVLEVASNSLQGLQSCQMGPKFPQWPQNQKKFSKMDISSASISDKIPNWFWDLSLSMKHLNLAHNKLRGRLPDLSPTATLLTLDLSYNQFSGTWPHFPLKMESLVLAGNASSGPISPVCDLLNVNNALLRLHLSENALSGSLPNCWTYGQNMVFLDVGLNMSSGQIPDSIGHLVHLKVLTLAENNFHGRIPGCINNFLVIAEKEADRSSRYYDYASYTKDELPKLMWLDSQRRDELFNRLDVAALKVQCIDSEQKALQNFKEGFQSHLDRFSSWVPEEDCCKWRGVRCENETGHVISLDLHSSDSSEAMQGQLRESLLDLPYMSYLDLSLNDFLQIQIPEFIGSLSNLKYLNLSNANFKGIIPDQLGNLSHLVSLDLSRNGYFLRANDLNWLHHLSSLKFLDLGGVDLSISVNWLDDINMLSSLIELNLSACKLHNLPQSLPRVNFSSLKILDLSFNSLNGTIPDWLFEIDQSLVSLYLRRNEFHGSIPEAFGNMTSLIVLDVSENNLEGPIPTTLGSISHGFGNLTSLAVLDFSYNYLMGSIPHNFGNMTSLIVLDLSYSVLEVPILATLKSDSTIAPLQTFTLARTSSFLQ